MAETILVLGGTSAIAAAYCRLRAKDGARFVLVGRSAAGLAAVARNLSAAGAQGVETAVSDLADTAGAEARLLGFFAAAGPPDVLLLAYGLLGAQGRAEQDAGETRRILTVNFTSAALWLQMAIRHLPHDRPRWIVVLGSVAGDRGRRSNYVYGAAKAGLAAFAEGLGHRLHGTGIRVLTVKPGLTDTPMTAHLDRSGPLWSTPEAVAACIVRAMRRGRAVVYAPGWWWLVMAVVRALPRPILRRTKL
jgi:decaprenylphospho-beta-D-erythro-pentofuranosid-2-ulose 2-reductase